MVSTRPVWTVLARPHPVLLLGLSGFSVMTLLAVTSPLPVILDAYLHDDSFYYLKVAENLASGSGSTFDGINYTNGYQPAWLAILTVMFAAGVGHDEMVTAAMLVQALLFAMGTVVLWAAVVESGVTRLAAAGGVSIVYFVLVPILGWDLLECGLNVLASACLLLALSRLNGPGVAPLWLGLAVSFAAVARTDHLFFVPIAGAVLAWRTWRDERPRKFARLLAFGLPVAVLVGGYLTLNLATTGHVMPVSGMVKRFWAEGWSLRDSWLTLLSFDLRQSWKIGLAGAIVLVIRDASRRQVTGIGAYAAGALGIFFYYLLNAAQPGANFWYYVPLYAVLAYCLSVVVQTMASLIFRGRRQAAAISASLLMVIALAGRAQTVLGYRDRPEGERADLYRVALELRTLTGNADVRIGAWDAGILGYYGGRVTNLDGLVNSVDYLDRYLMTGRTADYIREHRFPYIACYDFSLLPGGLAASLPGDYAEVFRGKGWVILKRGAP